MNILWTIGILHLPKRADVYNQLIAELNKQIAVANAQDKIEIITETDNGENTVGKKRNTVLDKARGEYVCFIDDDDMITEIYVSKTLKALESNPDVVELVGFLPKYNLPFIHNLNCGGHFRKDGIQFRTPNHLNTIKTSIARQVRYPEISHGEDQDYSHRLWSSGLMKTEALIGDRMYIYQFDSSKSETVKFMKRN
jgi:glycosyltransferase involved in cell wall biosynthesis